MVALIRQIIKLEDGTELAPNNNVRIQAMDWQVAEDETFRKIVLRSENDTKNLSSIVFTDILDPNIKWHARARALVKDSGWTVWGNLDVLDYQQAEDIINSETIPTRISSPIISTSSDPDNHDASLFTIFVKGFGVIGNSEHTATSWFIEDINGRLIWSDLKDTINKNKIEFKNMVLRNNNIYRIRAMYHSSSGDVSSISSYTIRVGSSNSLDLVTYLDNVDYRKDFTIKAVATDMDITVDSITWQIISMSNAYAEIIFNKTTTGASYGTVVIPANLLKDDTVYVLKFKPNIDNGAWKFIQFKTMNIEAYHSSLTVAPTELTLKVGETGSIEITTPLTATVDAVINSIGIIDFDLKTKIITALKAGQGSLSITAQEPDKYPATVNVYVKVDEKDPEFTLASNPVDIVGREIIPLAYTTNGTLQIVTADGVISTIDGNEIVFSATKSGVVKATVNYLNREKIFDINVNYTDPNRLGTKYKVTAKVTLKEALPDSWITADNDIYIPSKYIAAMANTTTEKNGSDLFVSLTDPESKFKGTCVASKIEVVTEDGTLDEDANFIISSNKFKNAAGGTSTAIDASQEISFVFTSYSNIHKTFELAVETLDDSLTSKYAYTSSSNAMIMLYEKDVAGTFIKGNLSKLRRNDVNEVETTGYYVLNTNLDDTTKPLPVKVTLVGIKYATETTGDPAETVNNVSKLSMDGDNIVKANAYFEWASARQVTEDTLKPKEEPTEEPTE